MIQNPYIKTKNSLKRERPKEVETLFSRRTIVDTLSTRNNGANIDDSFDGGNFDWVAAIEIIENQKQGSPITELQKTVVEKTAHVNVIAPSKNNSLRQVGSDTHQDKQDAHNSKISHKNSIIDPKASIQETAKQNTVASLRPTSWNPSPATKDPNPTRFDDPRQENLPVPLQFDPETVKPISDDLRQELVRHAELSSPLLNGWTLYPHQKRAILRGLLMRRFILGLDMGLGKTLIACVWAKSFCRAASTKAIVICPVSLKGEWKRTAETATGIRVQNDKNDEPNGTTDLFITSWAKIPKYVGAEKYVVIADEAHSMQSMTAARTKDALELMNASRCTGVLLLTGTPMKNGKPSNLFPLLKAVGHPFGKNQRAFEAHFCGGREQNVGRGRPIWNATGATNLNQLRALVSSHLLYLTKNDCLQDLPPQTRVRHQVPVSSRRQLQHNQSLQKLANVFNGGASFAENGEAILGAVQNVRIVGSFAKVDATVSLAKNILENEPAVVIFTSFQQVAKQVHQQLTEAGWAGELLTGETPAHKRQALVDNFQQGLSPVFVCTFGAGGVGLTLTAAYTVILLDRPWTPGEAEQAEDRVRRIGQTQPVRSIWVTAFDLDSQIDNMIESKKQTANAVLVGDGVNQNESATPKLSILRMLKNIRMPSPDGLTQTTMDQFTSQSQQQI